VELPRQVPAGVGAVGAVRNHVRIEVRRGLGSRAVVVTLQHAYADGVPPRGGRQPVPNSNIAAHVAIVGQEHVAALAAIPERELRGLRLAINGSPGLVPGLSAWLGGATDWELHRRTGFWYHLFGPHAAIDDTETEASLVALAARFRPNGSRIADFLDLAAALLRDEVERADQI
jgi:hypothetical protein